MNIQSIRRIDYWIGIPVCFFLSLVNSLERLLGIRKIQADQNPRKILFMLISELGSTVVAYPAFRRIQETYPDAEYFFLVFQENRDVVSLLELMPESNILALRKKSFWLFLKDTFLALRRLRMERVDTVIDFELFSRFSNIMSFLSGAARRVGFYRFSMEGLYRGNLVTHRVLYSQNRHMVYNFLSLCHTLWSPESEQPFLKKSLKTERIDIPAISTTETERNDMWKKLGRLHHGIHPKSRLVVFNPNASALLPLRKWPLQFYGELSRRLLNDPDLYIACIGVASEKPDAQAVIREAADDRVIDLTGETTLRELVVLFNLSRLLITSDCGPAHIACLSAVPILIFFGPETPALFAPLSPRVTILSEDYACSPCVSVYNHRQSPCSNNLCLQAITPESVFTIARRIIESDPQI